MKRFTGFFTAVLLFLAVNNFAQQEEFERTSMVDVPLSALGGFGNFVAGVDFDDDGKTEIYAVNNNLIDRDPELIPQIYKFEFNGETWDSVWGATLEVPLQNTWPALEKADLDNDGKMEIVWGPVNYLNADDNPNPPRVVVFEEAGDGSDQMGHEIFGASVPNSTFQITDQDMLELRPIRFYIEDVDGDGTQEVIFADRRASSGNFHYGVLSVDNIPDDADGTEMWTIEASGDTDPVLDGTGNKWDLAVLDNKIYLFDGDGTVYKVAYEGGTWQTADSLGGVAGNGASFKSSQVVDVNGDGTKEIVVGQWDGTGHVYLLQEDGDTLTSSAIANLGALGIPRILGGAHGDIDSDGMMDFVFGSRNPSVPNNLVARVEYQGGDIADSNNYIAYGVDSLYLFDGDDLGVLAIENVDGDPDGEILYTSDYTRGESNDSTIAIVVLDYNFTPVSVEENFDLVPSEFHVDQNYPNPFNPSTTVEFGLPAEMNVDIRIYDILGQEVAVLINNQLMEAGSYKLKFNAGNIASGTYIYQVKAGNLSVSKKMLLMK